MSYVHDTISDASRLMDPINRKAWSDQATVKWFRGLEGWTDAGERAAVDSVQFQSAGQPILDLGVGAGRTVPLLRAISQDYLAIDYTPELVSACREKYPDVRVLQGDARDLSQLADDSFGLVVFSFNGIDAVNPQGRLAVLREARRVLRPGGHFLFSTHNHEGPGHAEKLNFGVYRTRNPLKLAARLARAVVHASRTVHNYERYSKLNCEGEGFSIMNAAAHDHGILIHYISLENQLRQLESVGFQPQPLVFANTDGRRLSLGNDTSDVWWFHFVARK